MLNKTAFLSGERIYLRTFEKEDLPILREWDNDPVTRAQIGSVLPMSQHEADSWFERMVKDESRVWFVIVRKSDDCVIGECGLLRIFYPWRNTDLTMIIGDKEAQNQGYGTEAMLLLLNYAFGALGMHRVSIGVVGFNERALKFYEKIGFQREGIQRDGYFENHRFSDFVMMSILEDEFRARYL